MAPAAVLTTCGTGAGRRVPAPPTAPETVRPAPLTAPPTAPAALSTVRPAFGATRPAGGGAEDEDEVPVGVLPPPVPPSATVPPERPAGAPLPPAEARPAWPPPPEARAAPFAPRAPPPRVTGPAGCAATTAAACRAAPVTPWSPVVAET